MDNLSVSFTKGPTGVLMIANHGDTKMMANTFKVKTSTIMENMETGDKRVRGFWFSMPKQLQVKYPGLVMGGALFLEQDLVHLFDTGEVRYTWSGYIALGPSDENGYFDTSNHEAIGIKFQATPKTQEGLFVDSLDKMDVSIVGPYEVASSGKKETA